MPMYSYSCPSCGGEEEKFLKMADYRVEQICSNCNHTLTKLIDAPMICGDIGEYDCPVTGKIIRGRKQHEENLRRTGSRVLEPGETEAFKQRRAQEESRFDKEVEQTVEQAYFNLSSEKREKLAKEITSGANVEVVRL